MSRQINFLSILFIVAVMLGCKSSQVDASSNQVKGLFRIAILYPDGEGKTFDMEYYEKKHMPMVAAFLGNNLKFYEIDKGIAGRTPADKPMYVAIGYFYVADVAAYGQAIAKNRDAVVNDFKNYTNIQPTVQINQIQQRVHVPMEK